MVLRTFCSKCVECVYEVYVCVCKGVVWGHGGNVEVVWGVYGCVCGCVGVCVRTSAALLFYFYTLSKITFLCPYFYKQEISFFKGV